MVKRLTGLFLICVLGLSSCSIPGFTKTQNGLSSKQPESVRFTGADDDASSIPTEELPDYVSAHLPHDSVLVSKDLVVTGQGQIRNVRTGLAVNDSRIVGSLDHPADPLEKTHGKKFRPVPIEDVRDRINQRNSVRDSHHLLHERGEQIGTDYNYPIESATQSSAENTSRSIPSDFQGRISPAFLQNNGYGAHWGTFNGAQAFFEADGSLFVQQAMGVIDVSQWQGNIDWQAARDAGVQGAIIRIGYGWNNDPDSMALRNVRECKRLGIPFGVYLYSYAYDDNTARAEGESMVNLMRRVGVNPGDLSFPVFYDLERWTWTGHSPPTNPATYNAIVSAWDLRLKTAGYGNLSIYSYAYYLSTALNTEALHSKTSWVASYGGHPGFSYPKNERCWQYSDRGRINGINGVVDLNACGNYENRPRFDVTRQPLVEIPGGNYYINASFKDSSSVDITNGSMQSGTPIQLYSFNNTKAQQYRFIPDSSGGYQIISVNSGLALDVAGGIAKVGAEVRQFTPNGSKAQQWYLRDAGDSYYLQSALGNWTLDIAGGVTGDGTKIALYEPNATKAQRFLLASVASLNGSQTHKLQSVSSSTLVFDIPGGSREDGPVLRLFRWNGSAAQRFTLQQVGNGVFTIKNVNSGKYVEVAGNATANESPVRQYTGNGTQAQRWLIRSQKNGGYAFIGSSSNKAIDIPGNNAAMGQNLQIYTQNGSNAQSWILGESGTAEANLDILAYTHRDDLHDGVYTISSSVDNRYSIDVPGGYSDDNLKLQLYAKNGTAAQAWRVSHDTQGYVTFTNVGTGKVIDIAGGSDSSGAIVQQYHSNKTAAQRWIAIRISGNTFKLVSGINKTLVLDLENGFARNCNPVQLYESNNSSAQRWIIHK